MRAAAIVVAILIILLVLALVVLAARRNRRRSALRDRFGPEYDIAVHRGKDRRAVEQRLQDLAAQREGLQIRDVGREEYDRFAAQWADVQSRFVDDPGQAVADADGLVNAILRSRGYPVDSFDDRVALVATDHQDLVERYRAAHDAFVDHLGSGAGDTDRLRHAFLDYREVFDRLNRPAEPSRGEPVPTAEPVPAAAPTPEPAEALPAERPGAVVAEPIPVEREGDTARPPLDRS